MYSLLPIYMKIDEIRNIKNKHNFELSEGLVNVRPTTQYNSLEHIQSQYEFCLWLKWTSNVFFVSRRAYNSQVYTLSY